MIYIGPLAIDSGEDKGNGMASRVDPEVEKYRVRLAKLAERVITRDHPMSPFYRTPEGEFRAESLRQLGIHQQPNVTHGAWSLFDSFIDELEAKFYWVDIQDGWLALTIVVNTRTKKVIDMQVGKSSAPMQMVVRDWNPYP